MRRTKMQKGITLVALIITIIVLLILAGVAIASIQESDIIGKAKDAVEKHEAGKADEESKLAGYEEFLESKLPVGGDSSGIGKATVGTKVTKNSTINGEVYSSTNPVIPAGYAPINITGEHASSWNATDLAEEIKKGLVITDDTTARDDNGNTVGNEFVWIPVSDIDSFARLQDGSETDYQGVLYDFSGTTATEKASYGVGTTSYREPANLSTTYDNTSKMSIWTETLYQESFNKMVASVLKYGGFYVGRYETSLSGTVAQSKSEETPMNNINWYRMYEYSLAYSNNNTDLGITSEMIWGCQWDAMLKFILTGSEADHVTAKTNVGHTNSQFTSKPYETGETNYSEVYTGTVEYNDVASNIYDLEGNVREWTQEANFTDNRIYRGGTYYGSDSPSGRGTNFPPEANSPVGSRLALYVEL